MSAIDPRIDALVAAGVAESPEAVADLALRLGLEALGKGATLGIPADAKLLTRKQAARWLGISTKTLDNRRREGKLHTTRVGSGEAGVRLELAELEAYVSARREKTPLDIARERKAARARA